MLPCRRAAAAKGTNLVQKRQPCSWLDLQTVKEKSSCSGCLTMAWYKRTRHKYTYVLQKKSFLHYLYYIVKLTRAVRLETLQYNCYQELLVAASTFFIPVILPILFLYSFIVQECNANLNSAKIELLDCLFFKWYHTLNNLVLVFLHNVLLNLMKYMYAHSGFSRRLLQHLMKAKRHRLEAASSYGSVSCKCHVNVDKNIYTNKYWNANRL